MNKLKFLIICSLILILQIFANAQSSSRKMGNGIIVAIESNLAAAYFPAKRVIDRTSESASETANDTTIHRILFNQQNKEYYGYDLKVSRGAEKGKFQVKISPLSVKRDELDKETKDFILRQLPKYPDEITVNDGDTISLDILENPETKEKVTEFIKVTTERKEYGNYFPELVPRTPVKDFTLEDVEINLLNFEMFVNDKSIAKFGGGARASMVWVYLPNGKNKGRFIFSIIPRPGFNFQKIGLLRDETIEFTYNGEKYKIVTKSPIIGVNKNWNLWVLYDPNYKSDSKNFHVGATEKAEYLFLKEFVKK